MCGRFVQSSPVKRLVQAFGVEVGAAQTSPHYNVAPSQPILAVRLDEEDRRALVVLKWGLVPRWAKDLGGPKPINARAETVAEKPMFRDAFKRRRCLVPADAFYEWRAGRNGKQPYCIRRQDAEPFAFGGIWESWQGGGERLETVSILVTGANTLMSPIHDRMPVIVPADAYLTWLSHDPLPPEAKERLLAPPLPAGWIAYPVSRAVNQAQNDYPALMNEIELPQDGASS